MSDASGVPQEQEIRKQSSVAGMLSEAPDFCCTATGCGTQGGSGYILYQDFDSGQSGSHNRSTSRGASVDGRKLKAVDDA